MLYTQKTKLALRPLHVSLAPIPTRTNTNFSLIDIEHIVRIGRVGVNKGGDALLLIIGQIGVRKPNHQDTHRRQNGEMLQRQTSQPNFHKPNDDEQHGHTQIWLQKNQADGNADVNQGDDGIAEWAKIEWDQGNKYFPPTSFQISNIQAGTGAENVIPGELKIMFNLRFSTELNEQMIRQRIHTVLDNHALDYTLDWRLSGEPFLTPAGELVDAARTAIREVMGIDTELSTSGGTSDGRFIAPTGAQVLELGPVNATIHQIDECVAVDALDQLTKIYQRILEKLLT